MFFQNTDLFNKIAEDNISNKKLLINGVIDSAIIDFIVMQIFRFNDEDDLKELNDKNFVREDSPIKVYINSEGGRMSEAFSCMSAMLTSRTPVYTYCLGKAYSAGALILMSGKERYAQPYSRIMIHEISGAAEGKTTEIDQYLEECNALNTMMEQFILSRTSISKEQIKTLRTFKKDWFLSVKEAKKLGIIHELF